MMNQEQEIRCLEVYKLSSAKNAVVLAITNERVKERERRRERFLKVEIKRRKIRLTKWLDKRSLKEDPKHRHQPKNSYFAVCYILFVSYFVMTKHFGSFLNYYVAG